MNSKKRLEVSTIEKVARGLECDDDEDRFNATLRQIAPKSKDDDA